MCLVKAIGQRNFEHILIFVRSWENAKPGQLRILGTYSMLGRTFELVQGYRQRVYSVQCTLLYRGANMNWVPWRVELSVPSDYREKDWLYTKWYFYELCIWYHVNHYATHIFIHTDRKRGTNKGRFKLGAQIMRADPALNQSLQKVTFILYFECILCNIFTNCNIQPKKQKMYAYSMSPNSI